LPLAARQRLVTLMYSYRLYGYFMPEHSPITTKVTRLN
jgi:hypothetical protein